MQFVEWDTPVGDSSDSREPWSLWLGLMPAATASKPIMSDRLQCGAHLKWYCLPSSQAHMPGFEP